MYNEIENILVRTLSPFEYEQLEELKKFYTEKQIINAYKNSSVKNINYIKKVIQRQSSTPSWLKEDIRNQTIDDETKEVYNDFKNFLEEFRDDTNNNI